MASIRQHEPTTVTIFLEDAKGDPITEVDYNDVIVYFRKFQKSSEEKLITENNFREIDSDNMAGLYEIDFTSDDLDTIGEMIVQVSSDVLGDFQDTHLRFDIISNNFVTISSDLSDLSNDVESLKSKVGIVKEQVKRVLGLSHENFQITNHKYTGNNKLSEALIEIFKNDEMEDILATYKIESEYDSKGLMTNYRVIKQNN